MRIFKTKGFARFTLKESIADETLRDVIKQLELGKYDVDLGAGLYKQRIPRQGSGKSGGYRVIICFKHEDRSFFLYAFTKSDKANISAKEKADLKKLAKIYLSMTDSELTRLIQSGIIEEILNNV